MPSRDTFEILNNKGLDVTSGDSARFNLFDTLASSDDLTSLFEVLNRHKDKNGCSAIFTAMSVMANPDFKKIKESNFRTYFYESFTDTLNRYYVNDNPFQIWKEGIDAGIFVPQFHGREHLNVPAWMSSLENNDYETRLAFDHGFWGFKPAKTSNENPTYQAAFDSADRGDLELYASIIRDGLDLFKDLFSIRAQYFVPPNGQINNSLNKVLKGEGLNFRSTTTVQVEPAVNGEHRKVFHYLGQREKHGLTYIIRNAVFEPNSSGKYGVDNCLKDVKNAFNFNRPAIINSHRVNYIGALDKSNRDHGLKQLDILLKTILKKWPDVEFFSSVQLGNLIVNRKEAFQQ